MNASEIIASIHNRQIMPLKRDVKRMLSFKQWEKLESIFNFKISLFLNNQPDWRSFPKEMQDILLSQTIKPQKPVSLIALPIVVKRSKGGSNQTTARRRTFDEQIGVCCYCGNVFEFVNWTIDHITPLSRGGSNKTENKIGCCSNCNTRKGNLTAEEFRSCFTTMPNGSVRLNSGKTKTMLAVLTRECQAKAKAKKEVVKLKPVTNDVALVKEVSPIDLWLMKTYGWKHPNAWDDIMVDPKKIRLRQSRKARQHRRE